MHYDVSWQDKSKCIDEDPEFFFPSDSKQGIEQAVKAKAFYQSCPVKMKCLEFSIRENMEYGVYGGLTEQDRQELKHKYMQATRRENA